MKRIVMALLVFAVSGYANAENAKSTGTVKGLTAVNYGSGGATYYKFGVTDTVVLSQCAAEESVFTFDATSERGKALLSVVLSALMAARPVTVVGKGNCDLLASAETVSWINVQ